MASAVPYYEDRSVSIGRVFQRAFSAFQFNPVVILSLALVVGVIPSLVVRYGMSRLGLTSPDALKSGAITPSGFMGAAFLSSMITLVLSALVQAALTRVTLSASEGKKATFGESLASAIAVIVPLVGLSILWALGVGVGFMLFLVPGIILLMIWMVAVPSLVIERQGVMAAFRRSAELTAGSRWKIFGLSLVLLVIYLLIYAVAWAIGLRSYNPSDPSGIAVIPVVTGVVLGTIANTVWGTIQPSLYVELRHAKEGVTFEDLEEVFA